MTTKKKNYKIALIDQKGNIGGGIKFAKQLLLNFNEFYPAIKIDFYVNPNSIKKLNLNKINLKNISIKELKSLKLREHGFFSLKNSEKIIKQIQEKFLKKSKFLNYYYSGNLNLELEKKIKGYDFAFFLWPYLIDLPEIKVKKFIILHDFMFKYYFGGFGSFNINEIEKQNYFLDKWVKNSNIIVTSNYMKKELNKFYPKVSDKKIHLIRIGPLTYFEKNKEKINIFKKFDINSKYILCPTVDKPHKNILNLIKAFNLVKIKHKKLKLVFCGAGTNLINGKLFNNKIQISETDKEVFGLGFVSDEELKILIKRAEMTINTSIYDAGNGSGLDAWQIGSPVLMSNIPPFIEQLKYLKVKAVTFDPNNHFDLYKKINLLLKYSKNKKQQMITVSQKNIRKFGWKKVVSEYFNLMNKLS